MLIPYQPEQTTIRTKNYYSKTNKSRPRSEAAINSLPQAIKAVSVVRPGHGKNKGGRDDAARFGAAVAEGRPRGR